MPQAAIGILKLIQGCALPYLKSVYLDILGRSAVHQMSGEAIRLMQSVSMTTLSRLIGQRSSFSRDAVISFAGSSLARVVTLASMPFVTRIYAPSDLGIWAIVFTLANFVLPLATLRYDVAVVIAPTQGMAAALVLVIGACSLVIAAVVAAVMFIAPRELLQSISGLGAGDQDLLVLVPLILALLAAQAALQAWLTRERQFTALSVAQLLQAIVTAGATLLLPFIVGASAAVATAAAMLGLVAGLALTARFCGVEILTFVGKGLGSTARAAIARFKVYPLYFLPYSLSAGLVERVLQLVLASAYSISALGAFYVARQLLMAPAGLLAASLRQVLFAHSAGQNDAAQTRDRVEQILRLLIEALIPGLAFCLFWLKPILISLMGESWARLADFGWWTLFPAGMYLLTGWLDRMLDVLGRQRIAVALQVLSDAVLIGLAVLSPRIGLDEVGMVAVISLGIAFYNFIWLIIVLSLMRFQVRAILALVARACGLCVIWAGMQFGLASLLPGALGLIAASALLALSLAPAAFRLASRVVSNSESEQQ